jgi:hypothetical protein
MASKRGGDTYHGGGTTIGPRNPEWFSKGSTRPSLDDGAYARIPKRTEKEQEAYEQFRMRKPRPVTE